MSAVREAASFIAAFGLPWAAGRGILVRTMGGRLAPGEVNALAYPIGAGAVQVTLLPLLRFLDPSTAAAVVAALLALAAIAGVVRRGAPTKTVGRWGATEVLLLLALMLLGFLHGARALAHTTSSYDSIATFAVKGRHLATLGFDDSFFSRGYRHPSYPPWVPCQDAFIGLAFGWWNDRAMCLWPLAMAASAAGFLVGHAMSLGASRRRALVLVLFLAVLPAWDGPVIEPLADLPLALHALLAAALVDRASRTSEPRLMALAGVFAGLGALTKREGLPLAAITGIVAFAALRVRGVSWRGALRGLAPFAGCALALALPWQLVLLARGIPAGYGGGTGSPIDLALVPGAIVRTWAYLAQDALFTRGRTDRPGAWLLLVPALGAAFLAFPCRMRSSGALIPLAMAGAGAVSVTIGLVAAPWDHEWLLLSAADRLTLHLMPLLALALLGVLAVDPRAEGRENAERGPAMYDPAATCTLSATIPAT